MITQNIGNYSQKDAVLHPKSLEPSEVVLFGTFFGTEREKYFHCFLYSLQSFQVIQFMMES
jgi:hypothetical protein